MNTASVERPNPEAGGAGPRSQAATNAAFDNLYMPAPDDNGGSPRSHVSSRLNVAGSNVGRLRAFRVLTSAKVSLARKCRPACVRKRACLFKCHCLTGRLCGTCGGLWLQRRQLARLRVSAAPGRIDHHRFQNALQLADVGRRPPSRRRHGRQLYVLKPLCLSVALSTLIGPAVANSISRRRLSGIKVVQHLLVPLRVRCAQGGQALPAAPHRNSTSPPDTKNLAKNRRKPAEKTL